MATPARQKKRPGGKKPTKVTIDILLHSQPKRLFLAELPPPPISLLPPRDSTAFIVSKLVLPVPLNVPRDYVPQRRMFYTIGWTDLPSARVCVDAAKVLEYVSPRELEDWEYNDQLRREEEQRRAAAAPAPAPQLEKKRPGRPRKGPAQAQREAAAAAIGVEAVALESEAEDVRADNKAVAGPSLSTPSKRKLEELLRDTEAEETAEESEDAAIRRQLYPGTDSEAPYPEEMEVDSEAVDLLEPARGIQETSSRASSLAATGPSARAPFARASRASPALSGGGMPSSASSSSVFRSAPPSLPDLKGKGPATATKPPQPAAILKDFAPAAAVKSTQFAPTVKPATPAAATKQAVPAKPVSEAKQPASVRRESTPRSRGSTRTSTPLVSNYFPPASSNGAPPQPPRRESTGFTPVITPVPIPVRPSSFSSASAVQAPTPTPTPATNATPSASADAQSARKSASKQRPAKKRKRAKGEQPDNEWKVKALLADKYDDDLDNNLVRYFKVLWDGDWPPNQNPTWEPEDNISEDLKEEYLRKKERDAKMRNGYRVGGPSPGKSPAKQPPFLPKKRYSNVAEAFEGGIDELSNDRATGKHGAEDDDEDGEETFVVTDEPRQRNGDGAAAPSFSALDQKLNTYRSVFERGG
ncbi:hypothetical protein GE09DRAFT_1125509 [Coniochaeta sp. 2T2.1]|nr:hypothetical protein GE09DRAFT_1125509 [Coniochaeta sp. 2T2.1]